MIETLMELVLGLYVLQEEYFEEFGFEEDVDETRSHLYNCEVEEEDVSYQRKYDVVVDVGEAVVLFIGYVFDDGVIYVLFEGSNGFVSVFEDVGKGGVVSSLPFAYP